MGQAQTAQTYKIRASSPISGFFTGTTARLRASLRPYKMAYLDRINQLKARLEEMQSPARLDLPFVETRPPTQAFSEFLTNKEQGDWAERTFVDNFNQSQDGLWAVKYGRSEDLVAGETGFDQYYRDYQKELRSIGKRPDVLVFERTEFHQNFGSCTNISDFDNAALDSLVSNALAAIEVRSSAFISGRYEAAAANARLKTENRIHDCAAQLLQEYSKEIERAPMWKQYLEQLLHAGIDLVAPVPRSLSLRSTERLARASGLTKDIKDGLRLLSRRDFLSITPKAEDLSLVYRWICRYGVPHHYCQVFFDRAVMLSFEEILGIIASTESEGKDYFIESDEKNQRKVTFKINIQRGHEVMVNIDLPEHFSAMKELPKGRLLFYVKFQASKADVKPRVVVHGRD